MMIKKYQVDAFADRIFEGNPAVVCPVDVFPSDLVMQNIAMEHNLSETAFIVQRDSEYDIRWFTPVAEVELCGHATLASAYVVFELLGHEEDTITFNTVYRGQVTVKKENDMYRLNFPATAVKPSSYDIDLIQECFDVDIVNHYDGKTDCIIETLSEKHVLQAQPDLTKLKTLDRRGFILTATSEKYDFVSRFFAPKYGVDEDPVTGSAHTLLVPYWHAKLNKVNLIARQVSSRGGTLYCTYMGERVLIAGTAHLYSKGEILVD